MYRATREEECVVIATYSSASAVTGRAVVIDRKEFEHRVTVGLGHEVLDRRVLVRIEVWPGGRGDGDVALEYRSGLRCRDLADGIVTPVPASGHVDSSGSAGVVHPGHRSVGRDQPAPPFVLDHGRRVRERPAGLTASRGQHVRAG